MWELFFELCAAIFGLTIRGRLLYLLCACAFILLLGALLMMRWGLLGGALLPAALLLVAALAARDVALARDAVWRAACLGLEAPRQAPPLDFEGRLLAPTAVALHRLAASVDAVRRGNYVDAHERIATIERNRLRPEEAQLLDATRAMISLGLGDGRRAAQQAVTALPTGSDALDASLGRAVLADAWDTPRRLSAIERAWERAGVTQDPDAALSRLQRLARLRLDPRALDQLPRAEAQRLSDEARAIGADELAMDLDARTRPRAYR